MAKIKQAPKHTLSAGGPELGRSSLTYWTAMLCTLVFLAAAPFFTALFNSNSLTGRLSELTKFEKAIYEWLLLGFILLFVLALYFFFTWKLRDARDWLSLLVWLVPLCYLISLFNAASPHLALNMLYINVFYAALFLAGLTLARDRSGAVLLQGAILLSGYIVVAYGFANLFGFAYYRDAVMLTDQGLRLTSVFQYANAYAALLIVLFLGAVYELTRPGSRKLRYLHAFMLVPILVSFLLTLSRGGLVVLPIILLAMVPFLPLIRQLQILFYTVVAGAAALAVTGILTKSGTDIVKRLLATAPSPGSKPDLIGWSDGQAWKALAVLLAASLVAAALIWTLDRYAIPKLTTKLQRFSSRKYANIALPGAAIIVGLVGVLLLFGTGLKSILPDNIENRIENINFQQHSVLERGTFYKDAFKLIGDYPVFGAGGGGWGALYEKYQNNPYTSRQAHSFLLQYMIETGIVGFLALTLLIAAVFYLFIRNYVKNKSFDRDQSFLFYIVTVSLLVHSLIDFELSYVYLAALLFLSLGGMAAGAAEGRLLPVPRKPEAGWRVAYPAILSVMALTVFTLSAVKLNGANLFQSALAKASTGAGLQDVLKPLDKAIDAVPDHPDYLSAKISFLQQAHKYYVQQNDQKQADAYWNEIKSLAAEGREREPHARAFLDYEYDVLRAEQRTDEAVAAAERSLQLFPWDYTLYERALTLYGESADKAGLGDPAKRDMYTAKAVALYDTFLAKIEALKSLPKEQLQGRKFEVTPAMVAAMAGMHFAKGEYGKAADTVKPMLGPDEAAINRLLEQPEGREAARWYIASLRKQNWEDLKLYKLLIEKDPAEKVKIDQLAKANFGG